MFTQPMKMEQTGCSEKSVRIKFSRREISETKKISLFLSQNARNETESLNNKRKERFKEECH